MCFFPKRSGYRQNGVLIPPIKGTLGNQLLIAGTFEVQFLFVLLLMATRNPANSPVEGKVLDPIIYKVWETSLVVSPISEPSIVL